MNINKTKDGYGRNNSLGKDVLIAKGIKQGWRHRWVNSIHSGVRVKIQRKNSLLINRATTKSILLNSTNRMQSTSNDLRIKPEISSYPSKNYSHRIQSILNNSFLDKNMNTIGVQTIMIPKIDQQTSCNILRSTTKFIHSSSSSSSLSETSTSSENSIHTDDTSTNTSEISSTISNTQYRRNKNCNNNGSNNSIKTQLPNNKQLLQDIDKNMKCHSQSTVSAVTSPEKKQFFNTIFRLFSFFRLSSFKHDRVCISTPTAIPINTNGDHIEENKTNRSVISRCRRSVIRNSVIKTNDNPPSELASIHSISNASISTRKRYKQKTNHSNLSIVDSHIHLGKTLLHRSEKTNRPKRSNRKEKFVNNKSFLRKQSKHIRSSINQPSYPIDNHLKKPEISMHNTDGHVETCLSLVEKAQPTSQALPDIESQSLQKEILLPQSTPDLSSKCVDTLSSDINSISKCTILPSSLHTKQNDHKRYTSKSEKPDESIYARQKNVINEFKSLLQQSKHLHINNNALDDDPIVTNTKVDEKLTSIKSNVKYDQCCSMNNQNENQHQRASVHSSDDRPKTKPKHLHEAIQSQNEIVREGVEQLLRYQKFARQYKLKSNTTVRQFLTKSTVLSSESLYKLSINNEPHSTNITD